jgi:hypothetical protein
MHYQYIRNMVDECLKVYNTRYAAQHQKREN